MELRRRDAWCRASYRLPSCAGKRASHTVDAAHPARTQHRGRVDQSWRLLTAAEREALSRLSVFQGGFSAEAARSIAAAPLPVLGALADKSLLRKDGARIFLHPLVQQLSALRLNDGESRESTEKAHALYFHRLMAQLRRGVENGDRDASPVTLSGELSNGLAGLLSRSERCMAGSVKP